MSACSPLEVFFSSFYQACSLELWRGELRNSSVKFEYRGESESSDTQNQSVCLSHERKKIKIKNVYIYIYLYWLVIFNEIRTLFFFRLTHAFRPPEKLFSHGTHRKRNFARHTFVDSHRGESLTASIFIFIEKSFFDSQFFFLFASLS